MSRKKSSNLLIDKILAGEKSALSRAMSMIENDQPEAHAILSLIYNRTGSAFRIGITGPPGVGKSTLLCEFAMRMRQLDATVGIIAVDPSSYITGGALLGDRIRMQKIAADEGTFIRSMATRGNLGGLARTTFEIADLLDASGRKYILIETVGVGQSEIDVVNTCDLTVVVLSPESGDSIQAMKSGLMEAADIVVINKKDRPGADKLENELRCTFELRTCGKKCVPVMRTNAVTGEGVSECLTGLQDMLGCMAKDGRLAEKRRMNLRIKFENLLQYNFLKTLRVSKDCRKKLDILVRDVIKGKATPYDNIDDLVAKII